MAELSSKLIVKFGRSSFSSIRFTVQTFTAARLTFAAILNSMCHVIYAQSRLYGEIHHILYSMF